MADNKPRFAPQKFVIDIEFPSGAVGADQEGQISLNNRPFVLQLITHAIIIDPNNAPIFQDGQYRVAWSVFNQMRFFKGDSPNAAIGYGSAHNGLWIPLPAPVTLPAQETLHVRLINDMERVLPITVQVIFHGLERVDLGQTYGTPAG